MTPDIFVYLVDLPVREAVTPSGPCEYTVYINARLSEEGRQAALLHALHHIENDDFSKATAEEAEQAAHWREAHR